MSKAIVAVIALIALIAYGIWFEFFHPLSYSNYRSWIADCPAQAEHAKRNGSPDQFRDCAMSYDDWQDWIQRKAEVVNQGKP